MTVRKCLMGLLIGFICCNICAGNAHAEWSTDPAINNAISQAAYGQEDPAITTDGSGGAIITWKDSRSSSAPAIYAQRIDASGLVRWTADGVEICAAANSPYNPAIISDGNGGAIITWLDYRSGSGSHIYAQRINASGVVQWALNGVAISAVGAGVHYSFPEIISDGNGGAIITWAGGSNWDIYAQRINSSGAVQWAVDGVAICTAANTQNVPVPISDGSGGAIITWQDSRSGNSDIYAQRINATGTVQWTANGVAICTAIHDQYSPAISSDGSHGAIITWQDLRINDTTYDIFAQRINANGSVQWTADGVAICTLAEDQGDPAIISDGSGGAIITWKDYRSAGNPDLYAQRINASGGILWTGNGVAICNAAGYQEMPNIITDGSRGAIITWYDSRSGNYDIYAQRINASGGVQWIANGVAICTAGNNQYYPVMTSDGRGGTIITWYDDRAGDGYYDIYAQVVNASGALQPGVAASSIPTLNEWGMILFMLLMGATAIFFLKRMKAGARLGHP